MSFLDTDSGRKLFNQYLKKVNEGSRRVYRSEIQQFFDFLTGGSSSSGVTGITKDTLHAYQESLSGGAFTQDDEEKVFNPKWIL